MALPPVLVALVLTVGGGVLAASVLETPGNWGKDATERVYDVRTEAEVEWHPSTGHWSLSRPTVQVEASKWVSWDAVFRNALAFSSDSRTIRFTLEDPVTGAALRTETDETGEGGLSDLFRGGRDVSVVFREVPLQTYNLRVAVLDADGRALVERSTPLVLVEAA